jgi:hypothetical protein
MLDPSMEHARQVLSDEGFVVEDIPVAPPENRADLRLWFGDEEYVLEAKLREPHEGWLKLKERVSAFTAEGYASITRKIDPWNSLSNTITHANKQLVATPAGTDAFRVLWMVALRDDDEFVVSCLKKRLLGSQLLTAVDAKAPNNVKTVECYYHSSNDFERCPEMDAAVLGTRKGGNLFLNYFSARREAFRHSKLHSMFGARNAVVDPELEAIQGKAYMLGRDFNAPRDGKSQWSYLKKRYGVGTSVMVESQFSGLLSIPRLGLTGEPTG